MRMLSLDSRKCVYTPIRYFANRVSTERVVLYATMNTEHFADIIREAATSPLGIFALIILLLGTLAFGFFSKGSESARLTVWLTCFAGAVFFGIAIVKHSDSKAPAINNVHQSIANSQLDSIAGTELQQDQTVLSASSQQSTIPESIKPPQRATIQLVYTGDPYGCNLPITIAVADRSIQPTSNLAVLHDVPVGLQNYQINGQIVCPGIGMCTANGSGRIDIIAGKTYYVAWQNTSPQYCEVVLQSSG